MAVYAVPAAVAVGTEWGYWLLVGWVGWPVMGALVVLRKQSNLIGWLMVLLGSTFGLGSLGLLQGPRLPAGAEALLWSLGFVAWTLMALIVVLLPDGRVENRLGRVLAWGLVATALTTVVLVNLGTPVLEGSGRANPLFVPAVQPIATFVLSDAGFAVVPVFVVAALVDLVRRARRSAGVAQAQFRWILFGCAVTALSLVGFFVGDSPWWAAALLNAIPISIGIAVLRYRLWDIDRIVSRTVAYGLVTAAVLGVYAAGVTTIARLLPASDTLAVAVATLAAAAVFRPLLSRVQGYVDRRFDRARFDARREAEAFAARLASAVDPDAVTADLHAVLARTLAPGAVGVWTGSTR
jgi:hypothetical protein